MVYHAYILYSDKLGKFYTGHTRDLLKRCVEHNEGKSIFTRTGIPWRLVFSQKMDSKSEASLLELKIKKRGAKRFLNDNKLDINH